VAATAAVYAARELAGLPVPVPERRRQVPEWWRTFFSPDAAAFLYGLGLGIGFLTFLRYGTLVVVAVAALASGDPVAGAALVLPFGLARALSVVVAAEARDAGDVSRVVGRLEAMAETSLPRLANGGASLAVAATAALAATRVQVGTPGPWAAAALAAAFALAGLAKVARLREWREAVAAYRLGSPLRALAVPAVPAAELAVPALVLASRPVAAAWLAVGLLAAFTAALGRARATLGNRVPCGCFGRRRARPFRVLVARNAALAVLAGVVALTAPPVDLLPALRGPRGGEAVPAVLVGVGLALAGWMVRRAADLLRGAR
jgi:hypothetical protein